MTDNSRDPIDVYEAQERISRLSADDLEDQKLVAELVDIMNETGDTGELAQLFEPDEIVSRDALDEAEWLIPQLEYAIARYEQKEDYTALKEDVQDVAELLINPGVRDIYEDPREVDLSVKMNEGWQMKDKLDRHDNTRKRWDHYREMVKDGRIMNYVMHSKNYLRKTRRLELIDAFITGENALKHSEKLTADGCILDGDHVLEHSEDVDITDTVVYSRYAFQTGDHLDAYRMFLLTETPFRYMDDEHVSLNNSVAVVTEPEKMAHTSQYPKFRDSILAAPQEPDNYTVRNGYIVTPDNIEYRGRRDRESWTLSAFRKHVLQGKPLPHRTT